MEMALVVTGNYTGELRESVSKGKSSPVQHKFLQAHTDSWVEIQFGDSKGVEAFPEAEDAR